MIWERLKRMQCPKCPQRIYEKTTGYECADTVACGFFITKGKFESLIESMYKKPSKEKTSEWLCGKCDQESGKYPGGEQIPEHSRHCEKRVFA